MRIYISSSEVLRALPEVPVPSQTLNEGTVARDDIFLIYKIKLLHLTS
jgi:hypothetical protein